MNFICHYIFATVYSLYLFQFISFTIKKPFKITYKSILEPTKKKKKIWFFLLMDTKILNIYKQGKVNKSKISTKNSKVYVFLILCSVTKYFAY